MKPVIVTAKDGLVIQTSINNDKYGYIRVIQEKARFHENFTKVVNESALIQGKIEHLQKLGWKEHDRLPGQIVIKEQLEPFNKDERYADKDLKLSGTDGIPCTLEGQPIYRKYFYTLDLDEKDVFVKHDNEAEIKAFQARIAESDGMTVNHDFDVV